MIVRGRHAIAPCLCDQAALTFGIVTPDTELTERPDLFRAWDSLSDTEKKLYSRQMEVFAGFSENADWNVGRLLDAIAAMGDLDNTLIFCVWGDNGSSMEGTVTGSFNEMTFLNGMVLDADQQLKLIEQYGGIEAIGGDHTSASRPTSTCHRSRSQPANVNVKMLFEADENKPGTGGNVVLWANGKQVGEGTMPGTVPVAFSSYAGMDISRENGLVVDLEYEHKAPYVFTGTVKQGYLRPQARDPRRGTRATPPREPKRGRPGRRRLTSPATDQAAGRPRHARAAE